MYNPSLSEEDKMRAARRGAYRHDGGRGGGGGRGRGGGGLGSGGSGDGLGMGPISIAKRK